MKGRNGLAGNEWGMHFGKVEELLGLAMTEEGIWKDRRWWVAREWQV